MSNIRIVIGKQEIYPNSMLIWMDNQDICKIMLKTRVLGGAKANEQKEYWAKDSKNERKNMKQNIKFLKKTNKTEKNKKLLITEIYF